MIKMIEKNEEKKVKPWINRAVKRSNFSRNSIYKMFSSFQVDFGDINIVKVLELNRQILLRLNVIINAKNERESHYEYKAVRSFRLKHARFSINRIVNDLISNVIEYALQRIFGFKREDLEVLR